MATGERKDPFRGYNFLVEIDGISRAGFQECSGLDSAQQPIDYREGNDSLTTHKLPGLLAFSNIVLKRGFTDDSELWDWRKKAADGKVERKNGSVVMLDDAGEEVLRWNFVEGWPTRWIGPSFSSTGNAVAIESLEIAHEGIDKV